MIAAYAALTVLALAALAEWLHARRSRRVARLAFGPSGKAREWTRAVPSARVASLGLLGWGLTTLYLLDPRGARPQKTPEGGYRHLIIALDASPSMQLRDGGPDRQKTRAQRASELTMSVLERTMLEQVRISVVAFYTGAKPVVVDTYDLGVIKNILDDLPLDVAFDPGKTKLFDGLREASELAKSWKTGSTTLLVVSDGDTVPDTGMPALPQSISKVLVVGVGDSRAGKFIDGHQSRQDSATLRQLATRLRGAYHDGNEKFLPSDLLAGLSKTVPLRDSAKKGRRELALVAVAAGSGLLATLPIALALAGSSWQAGRRNLDGIRNYARDASARGEAVAGDNGQLTS
jgi:Ca-activated chloride channel family protein